jgi:hypothetical protein
MSAGFNTDVRVGEQVFHVQTEDRGPARLVIYEAFSRSGTDLPTSLGGQGVDASRERAEKQHRALIEELRAGTLDKEIAMAIEEAKRAGGIQVQLLNPKSWLSAGNVSLEVEVVRRADQQPQAGARVEAAIEGASEGSHYAGTCDDSGRVLIRFPLPPLGKGELALVILAKGDSGQDEIRFSMRSRPKATQGDAARDS